MAIESVPKKLGRLVDGFLSGWFQARCVCCDDRVNRSPLCGGCAHWLPVPPGCQRCGEPGPEALCPLCLLEPPPWDQLVSQFQFLGCPRNYWLWVKYGGNLWGMGPALVRIPAWERDWTVIAVPQSPDKTRKRGGDVVGRLAAQMGVRGTNLSGLRRHNTLDQARLGRRARLNNARRGFYWVGSELAPRRVILVDDIYTTGATVRACAEILKKRGAERVHVWTLFRTPRRYEGTKNDFGCNSSP